MQHRIHKALMEVEAARQEGLAECRRGRFRRGCFSNTSPAGKRFAAAYEKWMHLRAQAGDAFSLSLGYG